MRAGSLVRVLEKICRVREAAYYFCRGRFPFVTVTDREESENEKLSRKNEELHELH